MVSFNGLVLFRMHKLLVVSAYQANKKHNGQYFNSLLDESYSSMIFKELGCLFDSTLHSKQNYALHTRKISS